MEYVVEPRTEEGDGCVANKSTEIEEMEGGEVEPTENPIDDAVDLAIYLW